MDEKKPKKPQLPESEQGRSLVPQRKDVSPSSPSSNERPGSLGEKDDTASLRARVRSTISVEEQDRPSTTSKKTFDQTESDPQAPSQLEIWKENLEIVLDPSKLIEVLKDKVRALKKKREEQALIREADDFRKELEKELEKLPFFKDARSEGEAKTSQEPMMPVFDVPFPLIVSFLRQAISSSRKESGQSTKNVHAGEPESSAVLEKVSETETEEFSNILRVMLQWVLRQAGWERPLTCFTFVEELKVWNKFTSTLADPEWTVSTESAIKIFEKYVKDHQGIVYLPLSEFGKKKLQEFPRDVQKAFAFLLERHSILWGDREVNRFRTNPLLWPIASSRSDDLEFSRYTALNYFRAHVLFRKFRDSEERDLYRHWLNVSKDDDPLRRIPALIPGIQFTEAHYKDETILPPRPDFVQAGLIKGMRMRESSNIRDWLASFLPQWIFNEAAERYKDTFSSFGIDNLKFGCHFGRLGISVLVQPSGKNLKPDQKDLLSNIESYFNAIDRLARFYASIFPSSAVGAVEEQAVGNEGKFLSDFFSWFCDKGISFEWLKRSRTMGRRESQTSKSLALASSIGKRESLEFVYPLNEFVQRVIHWHKNLRSLLFNLVKHPTAEAEEREPMVILSRAIDPEFSLENFKERKLAGQVFVDGLRRCGYIRPSPDGKDYVFTTDAPQYVHIRELARIVGLTDEAGIKRFAEACAKVTNGDELSFFEKDPPQRFLEVGRLKDCMKKLSDYTGFADFTAYLNLPWMFNSHVETRCFTGDQGEETVAELCPANNFNKLFESMEDARWEAFELARRLDTRQYEKDKKRVEEYNRKNPPDERRKRAVVELERLREELRKIQAEIIPRKKEAMEGWKPRGLSRKQYLELVEREFAKVYIHPTKQRIRQLEIELEYPFEQKPPPDPSRKVVETLIRPFIASLVIVLLRDPVDRVITSEVPISERERLSFNERGIPIVTAKSRVCMKLYYEMAKLDRLLSEVESETPGDSQTIPIVKLGPILSEVKATLIEYESLLQNLVKKKKVDERGPATSLVVANKDRE